MSTHKFEESISQLERIVAQLQSGELPLDRALELFEQGVQLSRQCQSQLEAAERKVEILLREKGELKTAPFDPEPGSPLRETRGTAKDDHDGGDPDDDDGIPF